MKVPKKIKELGREKEISISMVTNGSVLNRHGENVLETIDGFAEVGLSISIDCIGEQHDYWRHKGTWDKVLSNLKEFHKFKLANPKSVFTKRRTAISWPNAYGARYVFDNLSQYVDKTFFLLHFRMEITLNLQTQVLHFLQDYS